MSSVDVSGSVAESELELSGLITGLGWSHTLTIELRDQEKKPVVALESGQAVKFEFSEERYCIGSRPPGSSSLIPCPAGAVDIAGSQCEACFAAALMLPCLRCDGSYCRNQARRDDCVQPDNHILYLASFGYADIKVGVARVSRRVERLTEQGALLGLIVARADGQIIRRYESTIKRFGVADKKTTREKLLSLDRRYDQQLLLEELYEKLFQLKERMRANWIEPEAVFVESRLAIELEHPPRLISAPGLKIEGTVLGLAGQLILIDDGSQVVAVEGPSLVGRRSGPGESGAGSYQLGIF